MLIIASFLVLLVLALLVVGTVAAFKMSMDLLHIGTSREMTRQMRAETRRIRGL